MRFCSLVTGSTVAHARVLDASLERHAPGARLCVVPVGAVGLREEEPFEVLPLAELGVDVAALVERHGWADVLLFLRAALLRRMLQEEDGAVVYMDPTLDVGAPLDALASELDRGHVVLLRRALGWFPEDGLHPDPKDAEETGLYSPALLVVRAGEPGSGFVEWWLERLEQTLSTLKAGLGGSRAAPALSRWLDLAPTQHAGVVVLDDPAYGVSAWNLHERTLLSEGPENFTVGTTPLAVFDWEGFDPKRPHWLRPGFDRIRVPDSPVLAALCRSYAERLLAAGAADPPRSVQVGRAMPGGLIFDERIRRLYERATLTGSDPGDPFTEAGSEALTSWMAAPAARGGEHGVSRYLEAVWRERPDVAEAYPDLDGLEGREFTGWAWVFGRREMSIPDRFLPPPPEEIRAQVEETSAGEPETPPAVDAAPPAVNVAGFLDRALGLGAAARLYTEALAAVGIPLTTTTVELPPDADTADAAYGRVQFDELAGESDPEIDLICVNADELPAFASRLQLAEQPERRRIGVWAWETDEIPERWSESFALVDEIWVYSRYVAENLARVAPVPVVPVPIPVPPPRPTDEPVDLGVGPGFRFLFMFDLMSTMQRKNPLGLVEAFARAFAPGEGPQLLIKTINAARHLEDFDELRWAARDRPDVNVVDSSLSVRERDRLVADCDCYVSLHRSEGYGLTLAEAMALGKPVIGTGYSGNLDFMHVGNSYLVGYELTRVGPRGRFYPAGGSWAEPDLDHAAALMRRVVERPDEAARLGARAREDIATNYSAEAVGRIVLERLRRLGPKRVLSAEPGAGATSSGLEEVESRLAFDLARGGPTVHGALGEAAKRAVLRAMKPYTVPQRRLDEAMVTALGELRGEVEEERAARRRDAERLGRLERRTDTSPPLPGATSRPSS